MNFIEDYKKAALKEFRSYKALGDKSFSQLTASDYHWRADSDSNSIAIIIQHMTGNMKSRWTDFFTSDGEKEWRDRDAEFDEINLTSAELLNMWEEAWTVLFSVLEALTEADFEKQVFIRQEAHTVLQAINRQLAHYPYHVGQIVYIAKLIKKADFKSLSIAKNKSKEFNERLFNNNK